LETVTKIPTPEWIKATDQMPVISKKILAFVWRDNTVCQAWWNGDYYVLVAADEQGAIQVYHVLPAAISHWCSMPEAPAVLNNMNNWAHQKLNGTMH
jgi:hypothetical protein